ncbi:hypothetical protein E3Q00_02939 [Wallemia mellicola]|nr:hypothetical protein E3Q00_02939 [Wallemia mellicola]
MRSTAFPASLALVISNTLASNSPRAPTDSGYSLKQSYEGETFFNGFTFFTYEDPTAGAVNYVDKDTAFSNGLAGFTNGSPFIQFDNWSTLPQGGKRDSVRLQSVDSWNGGILLFDVETMPYGLGTWPAFWSNGPDWPYGGELDIIEGVNDETNNHATIHTYPGCTQDGTAPAIGEYTSSNDCSGLSGDNSGCGFKDANPNSYGKGLSESGGGVFATEWDKETGVLKTWFFPRLDIPQDILNQAPNPQNWGQPTAHFVSDTCDIAGTFENHTIIINTTFCGYYGKCLTFLAKSLTNLPAAGNNFPNGGLEACNEYIRYPENVKNNVWHINYIKVFE